MLFDDEYELLHNRIPIKKMKKITKENYFVRGNTALLDAFGKTITNIKNLHNKIDKKERPKKSIFIIITDGEENSSHEYTYKKVKSLIKDTQKNAGFEYIFLGANIDAIAEANKFGIHKNNASNYHADKAGTELNFEVLSDAISELRKTSCLGANWKEEIETDFQKKRK